MTADQNKSKIDRPIIIIGTGRCGSTIFHRIFAHHPQVCWLSGICEKYPGRPRLNRWFMSIINIPGIGPYLIKKVRPGEAYDLWENHCRGFFEPVRDLTENDLTDKSIKNTRDIMQMMHTGKRKRLLIKITGWSRIGLLKKIFPDARFIHVIRDGRGVTNSLINVDFWQGYKGPHKWRWGPLDENYHKEWEKYNKSFVVLAAIQWKMLVESVEKSKKSIPKSQFMEIKYEDLMEDSIGIFRKVIDFCELDWTSGFEARIKKFSLKNMNHKWKENLTESQKKDLNEVLSKKLLEYNYR